MYAHDTTSLGANASPPMPFITSTCSRQMQNPTSPPPDVALLSFNTVAIRDPRSKAKGKVHPPRKLAVMHHSRQLRVHRHFFQSTSGIPTRSRHAIPSRWQSPSRAANKRATEFQLSTEKAQFRHPHHWFRCLSQIFDAYEALANSKAPTPPYPHEEAGRQVPGSVCTVAIDNTSK